MSQDDANSALRRKAAKGRDMHRAKAMTLAKALRLTVAKVADDIFDMAMSMIGFTKDTCEGEKITEGLPDTSLLLLLDGPDRRTGAAILDPALVGGLIQQQTMGTVQPEADGGTPRKMTPTDAAICAPFIDSFLMRAADLPEDPADRALLKGYQFGAHCEDLRLLSLALVGPEYEVFKLTLDLAGGRRQGEMILILPNPSEEKPAISDPSEDGSQQDTVKSLESVVLELHAELTIALTKIDLPLARAGELAPGDVIELGIESLDNVLVQSREGRVFAHGKLGQSGGVRAVQLTPPRAGNNVPHRRADDLLNISQKSFEPAHFGGDLVEGAAVDLGNTDLNSEPYELAEMPDAPDQPLRDVPSVPDLPDMSDLPELADLPPLDLEAS